MRKFFYILISGIMLHLAGLAQNFPIYSQYLMNGLSINPAYAGSREVLSATFLYRRQWVGFEGAPAIFSMGAHMPVRNQRMAFGMQVYNESIGIERNTGLFGNYAYRIRTGKGKLSFGMKAGFSLIKELESQTILHDRTDVAFENNNETAWLPNFGAGVYYSAPTYFAGISVPSILSYGNTSARGSAFKNSPVLFTGGYLFKIDDQFKIKPSTLVKYQRGFVPQADMNLNLIFFKDDLLWVGLSYRSREAVVGLLEVQVSRKFRIGYTYDYSVGALGRYNNGSHELMIRYEWRERIDSLNPLYF
jgi:type IX secretion system PorP/SprF family membrane protein